MNVAQRVAKNTLSLSLSQAAIKVINFIFIVFLARLIGVQDFGKYSFVMVLFGMLSLLANFGFDTLIIRDVARNNSLSSKYLWNSLLVKFLNALIVLIVISLLFGFTDVLNDYIKRSCLAVSCLILFFNCGTQTLWSLADAYEKMQYHSVLNIFYNFFKAAIGLWLVIYGYGLIALFFGLFLIEVLTFMLTFLVISKALKLPRFEISYGGVRDLIRKSWPFAILGVLGLIYFRIDVLILSWLKDDMVVGWYNAAYGLIVGLMFVPDSLVSALFPVMSKYHENSEQSLKLVYQKSIKCLFIIGIPITAGGIILSSPIILLLYGQRYAESIPAFQILSCAILFIFVNAPLGRLLFSMNKQKEVLLLSLITVSSNVLLNIIMIPTLSFIGSSIATVLSEIISLWIFFSLLNKASFKINITGVILKPLLACSVMALFVYFFRNANLFILIPSAGLIYFMSLIMTKNFDEDDKYLFKRILRM